MKKLILATIALFCATAIVVQAQDAAPKKHALTPEQQQVMDAMLAKYDTNKDGKLDKTERAAMSQEDKDKLTAAGIGGQKGGKKKKAAADAPAGGGGE